MLEAVAGFAIADVEPSTTKAVAPGASDSCVPSTVTAVPPGSKVWPPMAKPAPAWRVKPSASTSNEVGAAALPVTDTVLPSTTTAFAVAGMEITFPSTVMAGPPGTAVWPSTTYAAAGPAVMVAPSYVSTCGESGLEPSLP